MKTRTTNLMSLALISLLWFCLAFECKSGDEDRSGANPTFDTPTVTKRTNSTAGCPSEDNVKELLTRDTIGTTYATRKESVEFNEITFYPLEDEYGDGFKKIPAGQRTTYCPVKVLYDRIYQYENGEVRRENFDGVYGFYVNRDGEWTYFQKENLRK